MRCAKCKEVWHARPEEALHPQGLTAAEPAEARDEAAEQTTETGASNPKPHTSTAHRLRRVDREASADRSAETGRSEVTGTTAPAPAVGVRTRSACRARNIGPSAGVAAMAALIAGLILWRTDVVRLLPQTAALFKLAGINVNLRGLIFEGCANLDRDHERQTGDGDRRRDHGRATVSSRSNSRGCALSFAMAGDAEIYAWNTVLEPPVVNPGERTACSSRGWLHRHQERRDRCALLQQAGHLGGNV